MIQSIMIMLTYSQWRISLFSGQWIVFRKDIPFSKSISDLQLLYPRNLTNVIYLLLRARYCVQYSIAWLIHNDIILSSTKKTVYQNVYFKTFMTNWRFCGPVLGQRQRLTLTSVRKWQTVNFRSICECSATAHELECLMFTVCPQNDCQGKYTICSSG